ncbi:MAG TPA: UDP-N-acetylmuramoyl-L-alanyl-D-glutamate--2,6-diaminopimelate ligase [Candidatus Aminicenantes bacterium]|nr:UDP-N-acetylmuramoyl-L-alanyl-D-glutamate--2,6-diaminopimelate ligase [Candidatus Aminicenantes bacterium]
MKTLRDLLIGLEPLASAGPLDVPISAIRFDSRQVKPGDLFVAIQGLNQDAARFIPQAIAAGAAAVVSVHPPLPAIEVPWVQVKNDRRALSHLAAAFTDNPSHRLQVIGVTGTNGKTTMVALITAILGREMKVARIGTLGMACQEHERKSSLTTAEAPDLFAFLAAAEREGCRTVAMEVSSASLSQQRVADIRFAIAVFTSFSGDHLDFHGTMAHYFQAKLSLFQGLGEEAWSIICADDPQAPAVIREVSGRYLTYGNSPDADVTPIKSRFSIQGIEATLKTPKGKVAIESPLLGRINLTNLMGAVATAVVAGLSLESIAAAIREIPPVRGRLEPVHRGAFAVIVDYAHTDHALENLLGSLRELTQGRLIVVFGAGGARDQTKRPRMGAVAARLADQVVVTSDNPRSEDPRLIIDAIVAGFPREFTAFTVEVDRRRAIERALTMAAPGDVVAIAGKGHEDYQIHGDRTIHFDDREVVQEILAGGTPCPS